MYCKIQNKCSLLLSGHKSKRGISANYLNILTERSGMTFHFHFNGRIIGRGDLGGGMGGGGGHKRWFMGDMEGQRYDTGSLIFPIFS